MASPDGHPDEQTPLLQGKSRSPLPRGRMTLVFVALIAEPISSVYILPFINQVGQQLFLCMQHLTLRVGQFLFEKKS